MTYWRFDKEVVMSNLIAAVIVTYNPEVNRLRILLQCIKEQVDFIIIVDNNSINKDVVRGLVVDGVVYLPQEQNFGIAKAHNIGIKQAKNEKMDFVILFDQDSCIGDDFVRILMRDFYELEQVGKRRVAALGPKLFNDKFKFFYKFLRTNQYGKVYSENIEDINEPVKVAMLISSGSLFKIEVFDRIGLMNEKYFIDSVDTEWCFRAYSKGYSLYVSDKVTMNHTIGDNVVDFLGRKVVIHSSFRRYYIIRNLFYMLGVSYVPKVFVLRCIYQNIILQFIIIFKVKNKKDYILSLLKAVKDGVMGIVLNRVNSFD